MVTSIILLNKMHDDIVIIYTDGACRGNPGIGGWAARIEYRGNYKDIYGFV
jgi:ribonuclease HI